MITREWILDNTYLGTVQVEAKYLLELLDMIEDRTARAQFLLDTYVPPCEDGVFMFPDGEPWGQK